MKLIVYSYACEPHYKWYISQLKLVPADILPSKHKTQQSTLILKDLEPNASNHSAITAPIWCYKTGMFWNIYWIVETIQWCLNCWFVLWPQKLRSSQNKAASIQDTPGAVWAPGSVWTHHPLSITTNLTSTFGHSKYMRPSSWRGTTLWGRPPW